MTNSPSKLRFSLANRTLFAMKLNLLHINALGRASTDNFRALLPAAWAQDVDGYLLHSVTLASEPPDLVFDHGQIQYVLQRYSHYLTDMSIGFEDFQKIKSSKTRSTLRRKIRKFTEANKDQTLDWREYRTPIDVDIFLELAQPLAQATYQAKLFEGALPNSPEFKEHSRHLAAAGRLRCYLLFLDQSPVAYLYSPIDHRTAVYAYLGYDAAKAGLSPGTVLQYLVHESLFADADVDWFDFTEGEGSHKALFATEQVSCVNILCLVDTWRNRALIKVHSYWNRAIDELKRLLRK
ncbi:GNAT family N-acetyltransferase [Kineobactrum sediminis]|uniref:GNAT family N-acetyltransferase n=1 Tax=Kineobactrum sediminis TaxID=1905677 RepID=A0A2N5XZG4_9GAMM|nr:GNAT family N-acetyltransferase [Kineobactrum sediminis]PLW81523.1 GNAT family N-acetyltransferase [Kineobactrum sediminis]